MKKKKTTKKVTAPVTYDPGKGRPKEYLAYLNYQEMEALKRLNGEGPYKGPKGIPSFVLGGATTSGTAANRAMSSAAQSNKASASKQSGSSSVSRISGETAGSNAARASSSGSSSGSGFSGIGSGGGGGRDSGQAANRPSSSPNRPSDSGGGGGRDSGQAANRPTSSSVSRISGGVAGSNRDSNVIRQAQLSDTRSAQENPALRSDVQRTINVGPMGTPVNVRPGGTPIRPSAPRPPVSTPMSTQGPSFGSPLDARIANRFAINDFKLQSGALGPEGVPSVSQIAAENARRLNAAKMAQQYSQYPSPPGVPPAAPQGVFGPRVGVGTNYLRPEYAPGAITGEVELGYTPPARQVLGPEGFYAEAPRVTIPGQGEVPPMRMNPGFTPDRPLQISSEGFVYQSEGAPPRSNAEATLRAYEEAKRLSPKIQDRVPPSFQKIQDRVPTNAFVATDPRVSLSPGTYAGAPIDKPRLTVGRSAVVPTYPTTAPSELKRNLLADDERARRDFLGEYERNLRKVGVPSLGKTRGLDTPEKILEVEDYFTVPSRDPADVSEEMVPGFGIDVNNIPRVQVTFDPTTNPPRPSSVYSGYGTFNVPDIVSPVIEGAPTGGKIFRDRVPGYDISGEPYNPSVVVGANGNTVAYKMTDAIAPPPSLSPRQETPMRFVGDDGKEYFITREQFERLSQADRNRLAEQYAKQDQVAPPKPRLRPTEDTSTGVDASELATPGKPGEELTQEQEQKLKETLKRGGLGIRIGAGVAGAAGVPLVGLAGGYLSRQYQKNKIEQIKQYAAMTDAQKLAAEKRNPELVGWAHRLGIDSVNDYDFYQSWADKAGLRAPPTREGGQSGGASSGIGSLGGGEGGGQTTPPGTPPSTPTTPSTPSERRPDIYYMWDLGVNIPSPGDPNYTLYQKYLVETLAAQQAAGYV